MNYRTRNHLLSGASRLVMSIEPGEEPAGGGGGGAPAPAPEPAAPAEPAEPAAPAGGEPAEPAAPAAGAEPAEPAEPPKPTRVPWQHKRIDALTAAAKTEREGREAAEREANDAKARLAAYEALYGVTPPAEAGAPAPAAAPGAPAAPLTQADVHREAARIASVTALNEKCETLFKDGATKFGNDWTTRVGAVGAAFSGDLQQRPDFFQALTAMPNGADVYHALAGDLDHFAEVLSMGPVQLGMELATLSARAATARPKSPAVSQVPAPIVPLDGSGGDVTDLSKVPMSEYAAAREKQREQRYKDRGY